MFGVSVRVAKGKLVSGLVLLRISHMVIILRSYVCPSDVCTGSIMTSCVSGQMKASGVDGD